VRLTPRSRQRGFIAAHAGALHSPRSGGTQDPYFANVSLLLHFEEAGGATVYVDSSSIAHTTANCRSSATGTVKFGTRAADMGATAHLGTAATVAHHASLSATTQDFTIEAWVYFVSLGSPTGAIIYTKSVGTGVHPYQLLKTNTNKFGFNGFNAASSQVYNLVGTTTVVTGQWYFVQGRRSGTTFALAVDGVQEATVTLGATTLIENASAKTSIGNYPDTAGAFNVRGFVDEVRFTKGVARAFALPTAAFPNR
jgi:hypothetical protein